MRGLALKISPDLVLSIGPAAVSVSPTRGLKLAEELARASLRAALVEEAGRFDDVARQHAAGKTKARRP